MSLPTDDESSLIDDDLFLQGKGTLRGFRIPRDNDEPPSIPPRRVTLPPPPRFSNFPKPAPRVSGTWSSGASGPGDSMRGSVPFQPGELLAGKYLVERSVGRLGLGFVVDVRHADLGQRFVLKCLSPEDCRYPDAVARFLRGARAAMRLSSEYTARTIDAGRLTSGAPYVVAEALAGCSLREMIRMRGTLTVSEAADFALQAAESLAEAHSLGIVHKNLNPLTLFSTRRPDGSPAIKVLDYGVAEALRADPMQTFERGLNATTVFGSNPILEGLSCSSPEQLRSLVDIDARSDIWALGALLHEMLSGFPVYQAETVPGLLAMIAADRPAPITDVRSDVPAALESLILRCLEKDKNARFASVAEFGVALRPFVSPDAQSSVDRITRTLGRGMRTPSTSALVHVKVAPAQAAPTFVPPPSVVPTPGGSSWLVWSTLLVAFGLVGGTVAGVLVATRTGMQGMLQRERVQQSATAAPRNEGAAAHTELRAAAPQVMPEATRSAALPVAQQSSPKVLPRAPDVAPLASVVAVDSRKVSPRRPRPNRDEAKRTARDGMETGQPERETQPSARALRVTSADTPSVDPASTATRDLFDSMR